MQIKVDKYIQELLFENDAVNIPGLGGLVTEYQPAQIDHVQMKILPPAREVTLNTNLPIDDGLLTQRIADAYHMTGLEAEQVIRAYVDELHEAVNAGEIVPIEGVGRLYRNYEGELHLMTDHTNFDASAYGLPAVTSTVINRQEAKTTAEARQHYVPAGEKAVGASIWSSFPDWFQQNLWAVISVAMVVFVFTLWLLFFKQPAKDPASGLSEVQELPEGRINVSPGEVEDDELIMDEPADPQTATPETPPTEVQPPVAAPEEEQEEADTEAPTVDPAQPTALIRIGLFSDRVNVQKLVQRIYDEGFEPYTREKGNLIEVGVQFAYDDQQEIRANLQTIRRKFEEKARIVE